MQDAHEAIRPTDVTRRRSEVQKFLEPDQFRLYQLIWQRFVASQMAPGRLRHDDRRLRPLGRSTLFRATGSVMMFDGYHVLYTEGTEKEEGDDGGLAPIPPLEQGDRVEVARSAPSQHFTEPPPRFSEASLVKELERLGIGRPSTYSAIISTLCPRASTSGWSSGASSPPSWARLVEKIMVGKFPEIFNVEFTSEMEDELDRVEEGELGWQRGARGLLRPVHQGAGRGGHEGAWWPTRTASTPRSWPRSAAPSAARRSSSRPGASVRTSRVKYKDTCDYVKSLKTDKVLDRPTDEKCHLCGSPMVIKTGRFGEFLACTTYPECKGTRSIPMGVKCPKWAARAAS